MMCISWLVAAIAHERYSAVTGNRRIRNEKEKNRMLLIYLAIVFVPAVAVNIVKFFELSWIQVATSFLFHFGHKRKIIKQEHFHRDCMRKNPLTLPRVLVICKYLYVWLQK